MKTACAVTCLGHMHRGQGMERAWGARGGRVMLRLHAADQPTSPVVGETRCIDRVAAPPSSAERAGFSANSYANSADG